MLSLWGAFLTRPVKLLTPFLLEIKVICQDLPQFLFLPSQLWASAALTCSGVGRAVVPGQVFLNICGFTQIVFISDLNGSLRVSDPFSNVATVK